MSVLVRRVQAVEATMARFQDLPLTYGKDDCIRMAAFALKQQGRKVSLMKAGSYKSPLGAQKALKKLGYETILDAVDGEGLIRIAPIMALPGDLFALPSETHGGALLLAVGNGRAFGCFEGKFQVGQPLMFEAAWRSIDDVRMEPTQYFYDQDWNQSEDSRSHEEA